MYDDLQTFKSVGLFVIIIIIIIIISSSSSSSSINAIITMTVKYATTPIT